MMQKSHGLAALGSRSSLGQQVVNKLPALTFATSQQMKRYCGDMF